MIENKKVYPLLSFIRKQIPQQSNFIKIMVLYHLLNINGSGDIAYN